VVSQRDDEGSLLQHLRRLIARYRSSPEIGWGALEILEQDQDAVLAHSMRSDLGRLVALHNFGERPVTVALKLADEPAGTALVDLMGPAQYAIDGGAVQIELEAYGYRWLRVSRPGDGRLG
jgi:hypothetical protein